MRRLYYLANDIETTVAVADALQALGPMDLRFCVVAKDEGGLFARHVRIAREWERKDVVREGERWAIWGGLLGAGIAVVAHVAAPDLVRWLEGTLIVAVAALFGGWRGAIKGLSREHYKIARFHDDIEQGRILIIVDVDDASKGDVAELMNLRFGHVAFRGRDDTRVHPFPGLRSVLR